MLVREISSNAVTRIFSDLKIQSCVKDIDRENQIRNALKKTFDWN